MTSGAAATPIRRLRPYDVHCLRVETPARPLQIGVLARLEAGTLVDVDGRLRLPEIRAELDRRSAEIPSLRRVVHQPGPLAGRPLWVDDPRFAIAHHVEALEAPRPGDQAALFALAERLMARPLPRVRPLWRLWFVTRLADGSIAVLVVFHHALADGRTAMRLARELLDAPLPVRPPHASTDRATVAAAPVPPWRALVIDAVRSAVGTARRLARPATWRPAATVARYGWRGFRRSRAATPSSLNAPVGPRRRLATLQLDLATVKRVARVHGASANDVVLDLVAGGVRALLQARGETVGGQPPRAGVAIALFSPERGSAPGNDIGTLHVPLPIGVSDARVRLPMIVAERELAAASPMVAVEPIVRAWLGRFAFVRRTMERQRLVNLSETYLPGPPRPITVLGARVLELIPLAPLAGNLGLSFVALSYAGRLGIAVRVDAAAFPDLHILTGAMEREWQSLSGSA